MRSMTTLQASKHGHAPERTDVQTNGAVGSAVSGFDRSAVNGHQANDTQSHQEDVMT